MDVEKYLQKFEKFGIKLGLTNIEFLLENLGNPHKNFKTVHVAGTNGKGATSIFLSSIIKDSNFKVGTYLSPHVYDFRERIVIDLDFAPTNVMSKALESVKECVDYAISRKITPTYFEILTAIAFEVFKIERVDWAVIETGLGGRFDATNVISPEACIITTIEKEHTEYLGNTLEKIAYEKGGIIKEGASVILGKIDKKPLRILRKICEDMSVNTRIFGNDFSYERYNVGYKGQEFIYKSDMRELMMNLPHHGEHQCLNASVAISAGEILDMIVKDESLALNLPGRFQIINEKPWVVLDCAHNPSGIASLIKTCIEFKNIIKASRIYTVFGVMKDKDWMRMWRILSRISDKMIFVESKYTRGLKSEDLKRRGIDVEKLSIEEGIEKAIEICNDTDIVLITGSFYIVGEAIDVLKNKMRVEIKYKKR